ncbi:MAG: glycosyltransferase [Chitinivibrionales bacterium]|nr:glycosyltransferase [Chitinivibrionales bacterium]
MQRTLEIFTAQSGQVSAKIKTDDNSYRHVHSLVKPEDESSHFTGINFWGDSIIFAGTGLGWHLKDAIDRISVSSQIILVDFYDKCIDHCRNNLFYNRTDTLYTLSETSSPENIQAVRSVLEQRNPGTVQIIKHPASFAIHRDFYDTILSKVLGPPRSAKSAQHAAGKCALLYGTFFLQEELRRALERKHGNPPVLFHYENHHESTGYESMLQTIIQQQHPGYILSVNMKGFDGTGMLSWYAQKSGIPVVVWFVDDPRPILLSKKQFVSSGMIAFCWEKAGLPFLQSCGFDSVHFLPLAGDPSLFSPNNPGAPSTDLAFVGSTMSGGFLDDIKSKFMWNDSLIPLVETLSNKLLVRPDLSVSHIIQELTYKKVIALPFADERNITWLCSYIIHTASMKKRKNIIGALQNRGIETFGDPQGWRTLFGTSVPTHPDMDYATELCSVYRKIAVNINITSCQMPAAVNQRVFDIPLSGSFVLSDKQQQLAELFDIGSEAIWYATIEDLKEKSDFYRNNPDTRAAISAAARKRILAEHTYENRVAQIERVVGT